MSSFATITASERRLLVEQVAARQGVVSVIVEKDFWVCWLLGRVFDTEALAPHMVFKGGTSLSKVFGVIARFSEDIDLSVAPASLGFAEAELDEAPSASQRGKRMARLAERCESRVRDEFMPALEATIAAVLGEAPRGGQWLTFEVDPLADTPTLWFAYPSALPQAGGYVAKRVKLEIGALTRQQPTGAYPIAAMLADTLGPAYDDFTSRVVALELARTFWEKATILHAEFHRPAERPLRDRFSRHYADFAALWGHATREQSLARLDILTDVALHKKRFFASAWANYDSARPGTFRLVPPADRHAALARDYDEMRPMFLKEPPSFENLIRELRQAEEVLNSR